VNHQFEIDLWLDISDATVAGEKSALIPESKAFLYSDSVLNQLFR
jgi:hypothetical protein